MNILIFKLQILRHFGLFFYCHYIICLAIILLYEYDKSRVSTTNFSLVLPMQSNLTYYHSKIYWKNNICLIDNFCLNSVMLQIPKFVLQLHKFSFFKLLLVLWYSFLQYFLILYYFLPLVFLTTHMDLVDDISGLIWLSMFNGGFNNGGLSFVISFCHPAIYSRIPVKC